MPPHSRPRISPRHGALRRHLACLGIGLGGCAVYCWRWPQAWTPNRAEPWCPLGPRPVAIVGAGIAGLGAAHALSLLTCRVILLEARDRLGGRTYTRRSGAFEGEEEGARWIHGGLDNLVLRRLFGLLGLPMRKIDGNEIYQSGLHSLHAWFANGTRVPKALLLDSYHEYQRVDRALEKLFRQRSHRRMGDVAIGEAYDSVIARAYGRTRPRSRGRQQPKQRAEDDMLQLLAFHFRLNVEGNFGADSRGLRGLSLADTYGDAPYTDFYNLDDGGQFLNSDSVPVGGFGTLIDALHTALGRSPHVEVRLGAAGEVIGLEYAASAEKASSEQQQQLILRTRRGLPVYAASAIVTVPLGVLQEESIQFAPRLPSSKRQALQGLSMGALNSVMLRWPRAAQFWPANVSGFGFVPPPASTGAAVAAGGTAAAGGAATSNAVGEGYTIAIAAQAESAIEHAARASAQLSFYVGGTAARRMETQTDNQVGREVHEVLRRMFGPQVPPPAHVRVTRWVSDQWARGSYAYVPQGGDATAARALARPLMSGSLRFAGEATCQRMYATVHGAYISAMREVAAMVMIRGRAALEMAEHQWPMLPLAGMCEETCTLCPADLRPDSDEDEDEG